MNTPLPGPTANPSFGSVYFQYASTVERLAEEGKFNAAMRTVALAGRIAESDTARTQPYNDDDIETQLYAVGSPQ